MYRASKIAAWFERNPKLGTFVQFAKFSIVGFSNTLMSLAIYYLCFNLLDMHYQIAYLIAFVVSVTNAYYWNSRYVFKNGRTYGAGEHFGAYCKAFLAYGSTYLLSLILLYVWVEKCKINENIAPLINLLVSIPLNYVLNKRWAFKK